MSSKVCFVPLSARGREPAVPRMLERIESGRKSSMRTKVDFAAISTHLALTTPRSPVSIGAGTLQNRCAIDVRGGSEFTVPRRAIDGELAPSADVKCGGLCTWRSRRPLSWPCADRCDRRHHGGSGGNQIPHGVRDPVPWCAICMHPHLVAFEVAIRLACPNANRASRTTASLTGAARAPNPISLRLS